MRKPHFPKAPKDSTRYDFRDGYRGSVYHTETKEVIVHPDGRYWVLPREGFHLPISWGRKPTGKIPLEDGIPQINTRRLIVTEADSRIEIKINPKLMTWEDLNPSL